MVWKLLRWLRFVWWRISELIYRIKALSGSQIANGELQLGKTVFFHVPARVDGVGRVLIADFCHLGYRQAPRLGNGEVLLQARNPDAVISVGQRTWLSNNVSIVACQQIMIGKDCLIGDGVTIFDSDFHELSPEKRHMSGGEVEKVIIRDNVWLGSRVIVLKGVTVGEGSVVAPMSVVTKDIPANCVAAGTPAKVIRQLV